MKRCRFIDTPQGCKRGDKCQFSHGNSPSSPANAQHRPQASANKGTARTFTRYAPNGHCNAYYNEGTCDRGTDCKFEHTITLSRDHKAISSAQTMNPNIASRVGDFHSDAFRGNIQPDWRLGPFERLRIRLERGDQFQGVEEVYSFVNGLVATTMETATWTHQDTQVILGSIARVPGHLNSRLIQVLAWPEISADPKSPRELSFQRGLMPLLLYLSANTVINSHIKHDVHSLYTLLDLNTSSWTVNTLKCITHMVETKTVSQNHTRSSMVFQPKSFLQVILPLTHVLCQYLTINNTALAQHGEPLLNLINGLPILFERWAADILCSAFCFEDDIVTQALSTRNSVVSETTHVLSRLEKIVDRVQGKLVRHLPTSDTSNETHIANQITLVHLERDYVPPGHMRSNGPRHDNDHSAIQYIEALPTHAELVCDVPPYVPANITSAPHHLAAGTMDRRLDVLFRMLRENTVGPMQSAVKSLLFHLRGNSSKALQELLRRGGGRWRNEDSSDAGDLNIYAGVQFSAIQVVKNELCVILSVITPKSARIGLQTRPKLASGSMVGLLMRKSVASDPEDLEVFLGQVQEDVDWRKDRALVKVNFNSNEVFAAATRVLSNQQPQNQMSSHPMNLFEIPGLILGTLLPFLERLKLLEPTSVPFSEYIAGTTNAAQPTPAIGPPRFARDPEFAYKLDGIVGEGEGMVMNPTKPDEIEAVRLSLENRSTLDKSQTSALIDSLSREFAIIEGPPGTGKSFIGIKNVKVLIDSGVSPIFVIAYTNHALDQFLEEIYTQVTKDIVRCGSRSKSEIIQALSLHEQLASSSHAPRTALRHELGRSYAERAGIEEEMDEACDIVSVASQVKMAWGMIAGYLMREYPEHGQELSEAPSKIVRAYHLEQRSEWETQGRRRKESSPDESPYIWWREGLDLQLLARVQNHLTNTPETEVTAVASQVEVDPMLPPYLQAMAAAADASDSDPDGSEHDSIDQTFLDGWTRPCTNRMIGDLLEEYMLRVEIPKLSRLRNAHREITARIRSLHDERKLVALKKAKIIGCTTNGAANIPELMRSVSPRVLMVEEAGECLEAHIVANLVPSIEQIILIGDHLQLRPQIENYRLSVESREGKHYRLDESLFERLVNAGLPYSVLQTQRRMRPEISDLIRNYLYPDLVDHESVLNLPSLRGMSRNVVFFDHSQGQDKQSLDSSSSTNTYEGQIVCDLVRHFINQGYQAGEIAVLTPYLGQVKLIKQYLDKMQLFVQLDDRDQRDMDKLSLLEEGDDIPTLNALREVEQKSANSLVTLRSVDNFQGEEAKVVILSLVRNAGPRREHGESGSNMLDKAARASIGFLKSPNRTNVALSRAKHGMVILGNTELFSNQAPMWKSVIETIGQRDGIFDHIPIRCDLHPDHDFGPIRVPGLISRLSPHGGCLDQCRSELPCGHLCPRLCHPTDRAHRAIPCIEPCPVGLTCGGRGTPHVCKALCGEPHVCDVVVASVELPCGHAATEVPCGAAQDTKRISCKEVTRKQLPCGHSVMIKCGEDISSLACIELCAMDIDCKHKSCKAKCGSCRPPSFYDDALNQYLVHADHKCDKLLPCGHSCRGLCQKDLEHGCAPCSLPCQRTCDHGRCDHKCGQGSCRSCLEQCSWSCEHQGRCQNGCSMPCSRLPCDEPCDRLLSCAHPCPSICGEDCTKQVCPECATSEQKCSIVDMVTMNSLQEIDTSLPDLGSRLISLACGHTFTVETMDGIMALNDYYGRSEHNDQWTLLTANASQTNESECGPQPSCPNCRRPILSSIIQRYGRPLKSIDLSAQEKAAISHGSINLQRLSKGQAEINSNAIVDYMSSVDLPQKSAAPTGIIKSFMQRQDDDIRKEKPILTSSSMLFDLSKHGILPGYERIWKAAVKDILPLYSITESIITYKSPHVKAYETTHGNLYREYKKELMRKRELGEKQLSMEASEASQLALDYARQQIGSSFPRAASTFKVEAVWVSLDLRQTMLALFLESTAALEAIDVAVNAYRCPPRGNIILKRSRESWLDDNYWDIRGTLKEQWDKVIVMAQEGRMFPELTQEEKMEIQNAMRNTTSSNAATKWMSCPNGHPYAVGDCGQANQGGTCPECGAAIGGGGFHGSQFAEGNQISDAFQDLAI
ncbi:uncharacterized protein IL334_003584 [Kwoniella shivajii]|uniref:NFX1-type zinc finger-containing protein 1 n=1 Tax=Kwoniella shivajii TaxID=564305 RepID=A0ABZ1CXZ0_9TREE|nr:hypothetical protein IL334_003584 [Kwoniella shivajii]